MENPIWQKVNKAITSAVALALFTLLAYAEIYLSVAGSFFEANRLLFGTSFDTLVAGGPTDEAGFVACRIDVTGDNCTITAVNDGGETVRTYGPIPLK